MKKSFLILAILTAGFLLRLSGLYFGLPSKNLALTTYNPDEALTIYSLQDMKPSKLDFSPKRAFLWGGFSVYIAGFFLKLCQFLKIVNPASREFLMANLHETDKLYIIARLISIVFGTLNVLMIYLIAKKAYNKTTGLICASLLSILAVHVIYSFYARPDVIMLFFVLWPVYVSLEILSGKTSSKTYLFAGLLIGLATATKLSAGIFGIVPFLAHFIRNDGKFTEKIKDKNLWLLTGSGFAGFLIGCPYAIFDFPTWWYYFKMNIAFAQNTTHPIEYALHGPGWQSYISYYLPNSIGFPVVFTGLMGFVYVLISTITKKGKSEKRIYDTLFLISGLIIYFVISKTKNQAAVYTIPVLPFFVLFTGRLLDILLNSTLFKKPLSAILFAIASILVLAPTLTYSVAYLKLYSSVNTRELASEWIDKNIPKNKTIAIPRSYFWTPGILRQYNPPYKVLMGGDIQSALSDAVLGLDKISRSADYIVITEFEYRDYMVKNISSQIFPEQEKIIKDTILNKKRFEEVVSFDKEAEFLGFKFKKDFPPHDLLIPNPKITVYKKKA
ncbi:MAG: glycosyltransferase family 39 protein [Elusimicrobia bacterium]|nr:glycosyltransferase family 39 protein [Elusimicrobiota bacterium]MBU2615328.1 glycosyltransferase family 39 protein [Elusimicrobiota bacterium]